jgi:ADP-ribosylation factor-like protein 13B
MLLMGLDNAGKTTVLNALTGCGGSDTMPTYGFSSSSAKHGAYRLQLYDVGGGRNIRRIWKTYLPEAHGIIFIVDASDIPRVQEAAGCLQQIAEEPAMQGKPLLILANKQDVSGALTPEALNAALAHLKCNEAGWCSKTFGCTAKAAASASHPADSQLQKGIAWLINSINTHYDKLCTRVTLEAQQAKEQEQQRMKERQARVLLAKQQEPPQQQPCECKSTELLQKMPSKQLESKASAQSCGSDSGVHEDFTIKAGTEKSPEPGVADVSGPELPAIASVTSHQAEAGTNATEQVQTSSSSAYVPLAETPATASVAEGAAPCADQTTAAAGPGDTACLDEPCSTDNISRVLHVPSEPCRSQAGAEGSTVLAAAACTSTSNIIGPPLSHLSSDTQPNVLASSSGMRALHYPATTCTKATEEDKVHAAEQGESYYMAPDKQLLRRASSSSTSRPGSGGLKAVPSLTAV